MLPPQFWNEIEDKTGTVFVIEDSDAQVASIEDSYDDTDVLLWYEYICLKHQFFHFLNLYFTLTYIN